MGTVPLAFRLPISGILTSNSIPHLYRTRNSPETLSGRPSSDSGGLSAIYN